MLLFQGSTNNHLFVLEYFLLSRRCQYSTVMQYIRTGRNDTDFVTDVSE